MNKKTKKRSNIRWAIEPRVIREKEHGLSPNQISKEALQVIQQLNAAGFDAYIVGGCVRDLLIGKHPKDFDVVTNARPQQIKRIFKRCYLIGRRFRLAHIHFGRNNIVEVATFRASQSETHTDEGMIVRDNIYGSMDQDAFRRDFTVNALYYNATNNEILDFTSGFKDLLDKKLRIIGDPETRYREDPVRMLRAARFIGKLKLSPTPEVEKAILELNHLLRNISPARLYDETVKLFQCGFAVEVFPFVLRYGLFELLLPLTTTRFQSSKEEKAFVMSVLRNTDKRVRMKKTVVPSFLFAALLWPVLSDRLKAFKKDKGSSKTQDVDAVSTEVIEEQVIYTAMPRWVKMAIRDIWLLQNRLEKRVVRQIQPLFHHPRFRAGYDLLLLRASMDRELKPIASWWTDFQQVNEEKRQKMIAALKR